MMNNIFRATAILMAVGGANFASANVKDNLELA